MSKGSKQRPRPPHVPRETFAERWDSVLKRKPLPRCEVCGRTHKPVCSPGKA